MKQEILKYVFERECVYVRGTEKERELVSVCVSQCVCVCLCVSGTEKERERVSVCESV